ncbi:MAG: hypothetical protein QOE77_2209 [Blastocatellia bacterium]|jgi:hypothetical protein|nr:hypothetical protein [Blastocatellia bacterium]
MERELKLRIVLEKPTTGVDFGLQQGKGANYETVQTQRSSGKDLSFEFTVRVKSDGEDSPPNFLGPFVHGPSGQRFVYIDIGTCAGQMQTVWSRRLKIPLSSITSEMIDKVLAIDDSFLQTHVRGTGKDGGPTCGTVKPFAGWSQNRRR